VFVVAGTLEHGRIARRHFDDGVLERQQILLVVTVVRSSGRRWPAGATAHDQRGNREKRAQIRQGFGR